jgi:sugar-specific transcriptional regulator TrmB
MIENVLKNIGLNESEIKVYLCLLQLGDSTRNNIVAKSNIAGSKIYDVLQKLQQKGLVSIYLQNEVMHFKAVNPNQIMYYLEEKKDNISKTEEEAKTILPQLIGLFNSSKEDQEVELLKGFKGMQIIFREQIEIMKPGETCYVIGGTKGTGEEVMMAFFRKIHLMREHKKINTKMLYNLRQKDVISKAYSNKEFPRTFTKFIKHTSNVAINIYKDRTAILVFGREITAIHIKSQDVANSFLEYFNMMWND